MLCPPQEHRPAYTDVQLIAEWILTEDITASWLSAAGHMAHIALCLTARLVDLSRAVIIVHMLQQLYALAFFLYPQFPGICCCLLLLSSQDFAAA